jgi:glycosidase
LVASVGEAETTDLLLAFAEAFGLSGSRFLEPAGEQAGKPGSRAIPDSESESLVLDFVLFWLQRRNPAARGLVARLHEGFETSGVVERALERLERFLARCPGLDRGSLAEDLLAPLRAHPDSLSMQLQFMRDTWSGVLGEQLWRVQSALDLLAEEAAPRWGGEGSRPVEMPALPVDAEQHYAIDREWMPRLVMVAKNTLVWLQQMSAAYGRDISRLDQVPEAEMALLAARGITGLWLIGLWERSRASSDIKRRRGNPDAAASAYSLRAYRISDELGGEAALAMLRELASRHGIRLAADMVPNHMGIDSDWVLDHPERFVSVDEPPYPGYSFNGPDLSPRDDTGIFLEDHYYDGTDAAVVFLHVDRRSGRKRYIYHGNDGTSTPWNDTAQLDYLNPDVREAVVQTILHVARQFPVIRFDAAMTLAKRHYHRLWYPQPGDAGAVPSRSEHSLSREEIDRSMPREFWREVVDRVSEELPDTLLLAEAFWLMEAYFVRTLGLHRVYNSAFMHLLRDQQTGKFRQLLKETLTFDPEILRRYVNFMSNPDEETAAEQFGDGDRYFGVCTVLVTLPGLPMLAHGQWDGLREKYGMEFRRSYRQESPDQDCIDRHDRQIAPLLKDRAVFAGVESFVLYDFVDQSGHVRDAVLAYSNAEGDRRALVLFNNSAEPIRGRIAVSAPCRLPGADDRSGTKTVRREILPAARAGHVHVLRDRIRGLSVVVVAGSDVEGLDFDLGGFEALVLSEITTLDDSTGEWADLAEDLAGRPVADPERELALRRLGALQEQVERVVSSLRECAADRLSAADDRGSGEAIGRQRDRDRRLEQNLGRAAEAVDRAVLEFLANALFIDPRSETEPPPGGLCHSLVDALSRAREIAPDSAVARLDGPVGENSVAPWFLVLLPVLEMLESGEPAFAGAGLSEPLVAKTPLDGAERRDLVALLRLALRESWLDSSTVPGASDLKALVERWGLDGEARALLGVHEAAGKEWIVAERFDLLVSLRAALATASYLMTWDVEGTGEEVTVDIGWRLAADRLRRAAERAGYRLDLTVEGLHRR